MKKIKIWFLFFSLFFLTFLIYCFLPIIHYDTRYSQHVNHGFQNSLAPGRFLLKDRNGEVITDKMYKQWYFKAIKTDINSEFVHALLQIEDKNYYNHWWINIVSKIRAIKDNITWEKISGGSTITEQYIKNKYFKTHTRSYLQKLREAILALYFNLKYSKEHILNIYYHDVYFGNHLYGVGAAIEVYFKKDSLVSLTQEEIVILLSLLHNPSIQSLEETYFQNYFKQVKKRLWYEFERTYFWKLPQKINIDLFPFVTQKFSRNTSNTFVSIDAQLQWFTRDVMQETLKELANKNVTNAAVFAMNPKTKEILIYQGSKDFRASDITAQVDVIQALRQPGSTMKPFLYLQALESWAGPDSMLLDLESQYNSFQEWSVYISENYSLKQYGVVRLKKALGNSFNNATVRLAQELWLQEVYEFYKGFGFSFSHPAEHYGYSFVLGNPNISLENMVYAYSKLLPIGMSKTQANKYLLYDILSDPDNRDVSFWVISVLNTSIPQAVKTGTSSDFRDNLVISYHPDLVVGVWVGNNDNSSMQWVTGITGAGYIWHQVIEKAIELGYITDTNILIPESIEEQSYCLDTRCIRKENIFSRSWQKYFSRPADKIYKEEDFFEQISEFEYQKLQELHIQVR